MQEVQLNPLGKKIDRELEEEGKEAIKKLTANSGKNKQELVRKGADMEKEDDFDEEDIVDSHKVHGKLDKIIVQKKAPLNAQNHEPQKNQKKKVKKE